VGRLLAIFLAALGTSWGIATPGEIDGSATSRFTSSDPSSYLLVLALAITAVIAVVVLYFVVRRRRRALAAQGQMNAPPKR
jgi:heme/copper-type cytochrome/quinol oxidase subunit 2